MARVTARFNTPAGETVTLHLGGLLSALGGRGSWYECTGCQTWDNVTNWSNKAQADIVDYEATELAAAKHSLTCISKPK